MGFQFTENQELVSIFTGTWTSTYNMESLEYALGYWWAAFDDNVGKYCLRSADFVTWESVVRPPLSAGSYPCVVANRAKTFLALYTVYASRTAYVSVFDGTSWTDYTLPTHIGMSYFNICLDSNGKIHAFMFAGSATVPRPVKYCNNVSGNFTEWVVLPYSTDNQAAAYNLHADMDAYDRWHLCADVKNNITQLWYLSYISGRSTGWDSSWDHIPYADTSTNDVTLKVDGNGIVYVLHGACYSCTLWYGYRGHWNSILLATPEHPEQNAWAFYACSLTSWQDAVYYAYEYYHVDGEGTLLDNYTYVGGIGNTGTFGPICLLNSDGPNGTWNEATIACNATKVALVGSNYANDIWASISGRSSMIAFRSIFTLAEDGVTKIRKPSDHFLSGTGPGFTRNRIRRGYIL